MHKENMVDAGGMQTVLFYLENIFMCIYLLVISIMIWFLPFDLCEHVVHRMHIKCTFSIQKRRRYFLSNQARSPTVYLSTFLQKESYFSPRKKYFALWVYIEKYFLLMCPPGNIYSANLSSASRFENQTELQHFLFPCASILFFPS